MEASARKPRKSIWLSAADYSLLETLKSRYETAHGHVDWGTFLNVLAGFAVGSGFPKGLIGDD